MTSSSANQQQPQLINEGEDEDPYSKSEGHIEFKIEKLTEFVQEETDKEWLSVRLSDPVYLRGVAWKICAILSEEDGRKKPKRLNFYLEYNGSTDPSCTYEAIAKLKILAQKKGTGVDHVFEIDDSSNSGINAASDFFGGMTVKNLMNPAKGWYDEQADCIVLAMDLTVNLLIAEGDDLVGEYVLVAQNELALHYIDCETVPTVSMQIGNLQWLIDIGSGYEAEFSCKDVAKGRAEKVMLELHGYRRKDQKSEAYSPIFDSKTEKPVHRHLFTRSNNKLTVKMIEESDVDSLLFTLRVFKERSQFPDFTKPTAMVGRFSADVKLRVGDQLFHVNRQMLSMHSLFFDRMFHGDYTAATQQEVELSLNTHSPELFHQFLLVMCVNEVLPNSMNVTALFKLADSYDAENVRQKCDQHIRMAREMPFEKRVLLARDHCSKETQDLIVDSANPEELRKISLLLI